MSAEPHGAAEIVPSGWDLSGTGIPPVGTFNVEINTYYTEKTNRLLNKSKDLSSIHNFFQPRIWLENACILYMISANHNQNIYHRMRR